MSRLTWPRHIHSMDPPPFSPRSSSHSWRHHSPPTRNNEVFVMFSPYKTTHNENPGYMRTMWQPLSQKKVRNRRVSYFTVMPHLDIIHGIQDNHAFCI